MISLIVFLALVGFATYAVITYVPMPEIFRTGILIIVAICVVLYVMKVFGIVDLPVPQVR